MSKLRQAAEEVADKLDAYAEELRKPSRTPGRAPNTISPGKLERYAAQLRNGLTDEKHELNDMTGRRYGDNISLLCTFLAGLISNGEKRADAHGTSLSLRDDLQRLADNDEFWLQQCQLAKLFLDRGGFPRYEDETKQTEAHNE